MIKKTDRDYIIWQNRALDFYVSARTCHRFCIYKPAAYLANQSLELIIKATLIYWDKSFNPIEANHSINKMLKILSNKVPGQKSFSIPNYFYTDGIYQSISRYPGKKRVISIPPSFVDDLDECFVRLLCMVSFQFNSKLSHVFSGKYPEIYGEIFFSNKQISRIKEVVNGNYAHAAED